MYGCCIHARLQPLLLHELEALGGELLDHILVDGLGAPGGVDLDNALLLVEHVDHGHAGLDESSESLLDALLVVIGSSAGLASDEQPLPHRRLRAVEEQRELAGDDGLLELDGLVHLPGEAVDEELAVAVLLDGGLHGVLQQLDGDLLGHDLSLLDVCLDHLTELAACTLLLFAQKITGRQVLEAVVADKVGALGALACARTAEDEDDESLILASAGREERLDTLGDGERGAVEVDAGLHCGYVCDCLTAGKCLVARGVPRPIFLGLGGVVGDGQVAAGSADTVARGGDVVEAPTAKDEDEDEREDGELAAVGLARARARAWSGGDLCRILEEAAGGGEGAA